ncbi:MAG: aminopeptidase P family protein [Deltaproteobacteria bacterium]|nr:aminopeptidase P family protein [Deltaproteobacteria bacterium]
MSLATKKKISLLREQMQTAGVDAYYIPSVDPHQSEYVADCWQRRAWLSGFNGSAGDVLVTGRMAGLWTDGRYFIQAADQLQGSSIKLFKQDQPRVPDIFLWIERNLQPGQLLGADPRTLSKAVEAKLCAAAEAAGAKVKLLEVNLVDEIWEDRPAPPQGPVAIHPARFAGESVARKLKRLRKELREARADALVITTLDAVAWTFNIRGNDIPYNPMVVAYGLITKESAQLFVDPAKVGAEVQEALAPVVEILPYTRFGKGLAALNHKEQKVWVDPGSVNAWVLSKLKRARLKTAASPILRMKAHKNAKELAGSRAAHVRDGVAMVRFLHWLSDAVPTGEVSELSAAQQLRELRAEGQRFAGESFAPISGYAGHGAIVHYSADEESDAALNTEGIYLIDSGGQYLDGTTDITRTVLLGKRATAEQKDHFTRVLKGHIAIAQTRFPVGTAGRQIDAFARRALWDAGLDYAHGTGHGVGAYLSVHEGPQGISPTRCTGVPLEAGNILSNEPGYYREGAYGIRIENLVEVLPDETTSKNGAPFLGFSDLTLCPIDTRLVALKLLDAKERRWLNDYHKRVRKELMPLVSGPVKRWLREATAAV